MSLQKLEIHTLRNIGKACLEPSPEINLITGKNGSGKSALLEAIFILGRARSFRSNHIKQAIQFNKEELIVSGQSSQKSGTHFHLGIRIDGKNCEIRINQDNGNKSDLAYCFPVLLVHPKSYRLLDAGPQIRREFLDWGVFNDEESFLTNWRHYKKVLQQRNSLLKNKQVNQIEVWNARLIQYGEIVSHFRDQYLVDLEPLFVEICQTFLQLKDVKLSYIPGWDKSSDFAQALNSDIQKDLRYGFTHSGPHRGDFQVLTDGRLAKDYVSRGQLKLLMLALKLAQIRLFNNTKNNIVCVLIDDLTAELDQQNKSRLLAYLSRLNCQVFITTTELSNFGNLSQLENYKVFHVEQGKIHNVNTKTCST